MENSPNCGDFQSGLVSTYIIGGESVYVGKTRGIQTFELKLYLEVIKVVLEVFINYLVLLVFF